jgi:hypothetical protein
MASQSRATFLINQAITALNYQGQTPAELYSNMKQILDYLETKVHAVTPISVGTTGTILEKLCGFGLEGAVAGTSAKVHPMPRQWKWVGDFSLSGDPFNLVISCKSFRARERLLASGSGSILTPTIGWGAFNDATEFSSERVTSYAYRGFMSIYMPAETIASMSTDAVEFTNINGRPLIRPLQALVQTYGLPSMHVEGSTHVCFERGVSFCEGLRTRPVR